MMICYYMLSSKVKSDNKIGETVTLKFFLNQAIPEDQVNSII